MPPFPMTLAARLLTLLGCSSLAVAFVMHWSMFVVVLGFKHVSAGGGEFAVALFIGVPAALLSFVLLATTAIRPVWRSTAGVIALGATVALLLSWFIVAAIWP